MHYKFLFSNFPIQTTNLIQKLTWSSTLIIIYHNSSKNIRENKLCSIVFSSTLIKLVSDLFLLCEKISHIVDYIYLRFTTTIIRQ